MDTIYTDLATAIIDELLADAAQRTEYAQEFCADTAIHIFGTVAELAGRLAFAFYITTVLAGLTLLCTNLSAVHETHDLFIKGQDVVLALPPSTEPAALLTAAPTVIPPALEAIAYFQVFDDVQLVQEIAQAAEVLAEAVDLEPIMAWSYDELMQFKSRELKRMARKEGISGYGSMTKHQLSLELASA